jgi:hypothetical protein
MRDTTSTTGNSMTKVAGPMPVKQDRRERSRLRELCDEVLASFRVAQSRELLSEQEIAESRKLLATMTPALFGR